MNQNDTIKATNQGTKQHSNASSSSMRNPPTTSISTTTTSHHRRFQAPFTNGNSSAPSVHSTPTPTRAAAAAIWSPSSVMSSSSSSSFGPTAAALPSSVVPPSPQQQNSSAQMLSLHHKAADSNADGHSNGKDADLTSKTSQSRRKRKSSTLISPISTTEDGTTANNSFSTRISFPKRTSTSTQQSNLTNRRSIFNNGASNRNSLTSLYSAAQPDEDFHSHAPTLSRRSRRYSTATQDAADHRGGSVNQYTSLDWMERLKRRLKDALEPRLLVRSFSKRVSQFDTLLPFVTLLPDVVTLLYCFGILQWEEFGNNYQQVEGCTNVMHVGIVILVQGYLSALLLLLLVVAPLICISLNPGWNTRIFRSILFLVLSGFTLLRIPLVVLLQIWLADANCGPKVSYFWWAFIACVLMWINLIWSIVFWCVGLVIRVIYIMGEIYVLRQSKR